MEQINAWEEGLNNSFIYFKSKKELIDYIRFNNVNYFCVDAENKTEFLSNFAYIDISKTLYINEKFYRDNKRELDNYFIENLIFASNIMMSKHIYSEDIIKKMICAEIIVFDSEIGVSEQIKEFLVSRGIKLFIKTGDDIVSLIPDDALGAHK